MQHIECEGQEYVQHSFFSESSYMGGQYSVSSLTLVIRVHLHNGSVSPCTMVVRVHLHSESVPPCTKVVSVLPVQWLSVCPIHW